MSLAPGQSLLHYTLTEQIGAGGMGVVYSATDTKLHRDVAIKVLPDDFAHDPERLARFEREARTLASLNHPGIASIHGLEDADGVRFLVLELVPGETLADRLARGAFSIEETLAVARQIAEALEDAHDHGIVHRDLKPANIKLTAEGNAKVLDFGLAKALVGEKPTADLSQSPTATIEGTRAGVILGTAPYMSPEQAKGLPLDRRTDIFAFGCVLYEMLTGAPTFRGETVTDVVAAVLTREPDWTRLPPAVPVPLKRLLRRCLAKDKTQRLQHLGDALLELQDALEGSLEEVQPNTNTVTSAKRFGVVPGLVAVVAALAVGALGMWALDRPPSGARATPKVFSINLEHPLKGGGLAGRSFDVSRDGTMLVYSGTTGPASKLYLRRIDQWDVQPVPGTEGAGDPVFSPDGQWILYTARGQLFKVSTGGGQPILLCNAPGVPYGIDWSQEGTIVLTTHLSDGFYKMSDQGESIEEIPVGDRPGLFRWPEILPGARAVVGVLYHSEDDEATRQIVVVDIDTGELKTLMPGTSPRHLPTGHLLYKLGSAVLVVPFDAQRKEVTGSAAALPFDVDELHGKMLLTTSDSGDLIYATPGHRSSHQLVWVDRDGRTRPAISQRGDYYAPRVSRDGRRITWATAISPLGDVWVYDVRGDFLSRVTEEGFDAYPTWYPDGQRLAFSTDRGFEFELYAKPADRIGGEVKLTETPNVDVPISIAPDGTVFFYQVSADTQRDIFALKSNGVIETLVKERHNERSPSVSPDGKWFAYVSDEAGRDEIYVQPYPTTGKRWRVSHDGGAEPRWAPDGSAIYFRRGEALLEAPVTLTPEFSSAPPVELFRGQFVLDNFGNPNFDVSPDGKRFLMVQGELAEPAHLKVVVNWFGSF